MKTKNILISLFTVCVFASCSAVDDSKFTLSGEIEHAEGIQTVLLYEGETLADSAGLDKDNRFYLEGNAPEPALYTLVVGQRPYMLILENGQQVKLRADAKNPGSYEITGSESSARLRELDAARERFQEQQGQLQADFEKRMNNGEDMATLQGELMAKNDQYVQQLSKDVLDFSLKNKDNLAGFYGMMILYTVDPSGNEAAIIEYMDEAKEKFPNNDAVQSLAAHLEQIKPLSVGQPAPDFASTTPDGKQVRLSDFKGKYVLLDFWAAWCAPCRQENPNIVQQYHAFKDKGFTVLGVSLDREREDWLKAIKDDKLEWTQVSDLKMWNSEAGQLYNIIAIPASFMIGPDGKIVAKNLRGPALKAFLDENL